MPKKKPRNTRTVKPVFRIFCEGAKTEPLYIKGYLSYFHSEHRNLIVIEDTSKNTPVQLVSEAIKAKNSGKNNDVYWVVYDRESSAKYPDALHKKARKTADDNNIEIGFSNVCFEYWLLLHLCYTDASYESCDDLLKRSQLKEKLKTVGISNYEKSLPLLFDKLKGKVEYAKNNAEKLKKAVIDSSDPAHCHPCELSPYVDVHELFIDIDRFINGDKSVRK